MSSKYPKDGQVADAIERAQSQQPRLEGTGPTFARIFTWLQDVDKQQPAFTTDNRKLDTWLRQFPTKEPFLEGVLSTVVSIDKNRGWELLGGQRIVQKYVKILHDFAAAPDLYGWRPAISATAQNFYSTNIGGIVELGWDGNRLGGLYAVDSAKCHLTGKPDKPLKYKPTNAKEQEWDADVYFRIPDMPSPDEDLNGLGVCAVMRCIEMARIMVALYQHDLEKLLARAPKGLLILKGISEEQWETSLESNAEKMTALEREYYTGIQVLASEGLTDVDAKVVGLSSIPEGLDHQTFSNLIMYLYALAFKYDPREFWPVSGGQLGTATETETQHRKATSKGGLDFALAFQENLQDVLPVTVDFEFEQRDVGGETMDQQLHSAIIANVTALQGIGISKLQAFQMLAEENVIPAEWVEGEELLAEDTEDNPDTEGILPGAVDATAEEGAAGGGSSQMIDLNAILQREAVQRSLFHWPTEPIVRYNSKTRKTQVIPVEPVYRKFFILRAGNMENLSVHIANVIGDDADGFFTRCMDMDELQDYDEDARGAICARAHYDNFGKWPSEKE